MQHNIQAQTIAAFPAFTGLGHSALNYILKAATQRSYKKGEEIFLQDQQANAFYLLLSGHVSASKITPGGDLAILRYFARGSLFGIAPAIGVKKYPASATAIEDCNTLKWNIDCWADFATRFPLLATNILAIVGEKFTRTTAQAVELLTLQVEQRIACALLRLCEDTGKPVPNGVLINVPLMRKDLSGMTGATLHTVSRLLSCWQKNGLVESRNKRITITNMAQLRALSEGKINGITSPVRKMPVQYRTRQSQHLRG